jgi:hypothetical protein
MTPWAAARRCATGGYGQEGRSAILLLLGRQERLPPAKVVRVDVADIRRHELVPERPVALGRSSRASKGS